MSVIEQMRADLKERIEYADEHALHIVDAVLNAEESFEEQHTSEIPERQQAEVLRRIQEWRENPSIAISLEDAMKYLERKAAENGAL